MNLSSSTTPDPGRQRPGGAPVRPSGGPPYWQPGTPIWWLYRRRTWANGRPELLRPMTVVRDDADALVAWLAPGTPVLRPVLADGRDLRTASLADWFAAGSGWALRRDVWHGTGILKIAPTGVPWSVWLFWHPDGTFRNWYVNLEDVHVRDDSHVITQDHELDLVVRPDRAVRWKDEDELAAAVEAGRFSAADAARFEQDARAVERVVASWGPPFCDDWQSFRPDPSWPLPTLPVGIRADF